jgi:hypothetical protein
MGDTIAILLHGYGDYGYTGSILDEPGPRGVEQSLCVATQGGHFLVDHIVWVQCAIKTIDYMLGDPVPLR